MRHRIARFFLLLTGLTLATPASAQDGPTAVVQRLNDTLLGVMQEAESLGFAGRYDRLEPVLGQIFAFPTMARVAAGSHWRGLSDEQRERLADAFARFSIATYANRFDGYFGEHFKTISEEELKRGHRLVKTVLIKSNGEEIQLDYILHQKNEQWRIINVIAEGVSDLSLKRADYTSYLKKNGFDALLQKITDKIKSYEG